MLESGLLLVLLAGGFLGVTAVAVFYFQKARSPLHHPGSSPAELEQLRQECDQLKTQILDLSDSSRQLQAGINGLGAALWDWNLQTRQLSVSQLFLELTGYQRSEFTRNMARIIRLIHPEDVPEVRAIFRDYLAGNIERCNFEMRMKFGDGEFHWVEVRALVTRNDKGHPLRIVGSMTDVSNKILAEQERDRLFNLSVDMLAVGGFDGSFHQLNPAWVRVLGWSRDDILGENLRHFIHPDDLNIVGATLESLQSGDTVRGVESRFQCRDGSFRWLSWSSFPYPEQELIFSVARDVTEQKEAETVVLQYQDQLRSLSNQLSLVEDRQRQQLANAIHDGLAQQLFGIRAKVTLLKYPDKVSNYQGEIAEILQVIDDTMKETRNLSFDLFPPVLHEVGLEAALSWLAHHHHERTGLKIEVTEDGEGLELSEDLRAMAYQCVRELLNNVYKHAEATHVNITLTYVPEFLTILVDDNGVGFEVSRTGPPQADQTSGFGLFSIRERLRAVGGRMLLDSTPGKGSRVFLTMPRDL